MRPPRPRPPRRQEDPDEVRLDALLVGDIQPGCEWRTEACRHRIAFNLTCAGCGSSEDYCAAHTRRIMTAFEASCKKCGRAGAPRTVIQVREIRGI